LVEFTGILPSAKRNDVASAEAARKARVGNGRRAAGRASTSGKRFGFASCNRP
jgi:hypothetical protein